MAIERYDVGHGGEYLSTDGDFVEYDAYAEAVQHAHAVGFREGVIRERARWENALQAVGKEELGIGYSKVRIIQMVREACAEQGKPEGDDG